ncbi:MAG: NAD(P)-binding domain-containing protein [Ferrovibrio sp.]|uniref:NAD(P)-binding domain-containing protein n=1 Tax=Ferrovibrio sp. TaxID=1917215 RepID=UPI00391CDF16
MTRLNNNAAVTIMGTGEMAAAYISALLTLGVPAEHIRVTGRSAEKYTALAHRFGIQGLSLPALRGDGPAILAVTQDALPAVTRQALAAGFRHLLIEKPGALSSTALAGLTKDVADAKANAFVAFNRRFYPSVIALRNAIAEDGGIRTVFFEFTEVERLVLAEQEMKRLPKIVTDRWGLSNSTHVIDLVVFLMGKPVTMSPLQEGSLPWHETAASFAGSGRSERGAIFSYLASWGTAGRWRVEVTTPARRLFLCPLETLQVQMKNSFSVEPIVIASEPTNVKPGLAGMLAEFLQPHGARPTNLPDLYESVQTLRIAETICGYTQNSVA